MNLPRRIDKFVREATKHNLVQVRAWLQSGAVSCKRLALPGLPLDEEALVYDHDTILLSGQKLVLPTHHHTYLLNKPRSVTSTASDPRGKQDLSAWLARMAPGTFPVGRLDRDTTGALLCTTDSELSSAILRPDHATTKTYWLWLNEALTADDPRLTEWIVGIPMLGSVGKAVHVEILTATEDMTELLVTLSEGKNRQIRRMCAAVDFRLLHLHRRSVGPVHVEGQELGAFRELSSREMEDLWIYLGGVSQVRARKREALERKAHDLREEGSPDSLLEQWLEQHPPGIFGG